MTLVLSCLTERFVLQVSDRRLTNVVSGRPVPGEFNKAVGFTNKITFAYTGLAEIDGEDTDEWLANALASGDDESEGLDAVRDRATPAFTRLSAPLALKAHAFVGVGWDRVPKYGGWVSLICWVSNVMDAGGRWQPPPRDEFELHLSHMPSTARGHAVALSVVGQRLTRTEHARLMRDLRRYDEHGLGPAAFSDRLVKQVRAVAARNPTVSPEIMISAIPLLPEKFESGELMALSARPTLETQSFSYIPAEGRAEVGLAPRFAFPGGGQVFDYSERELDAPGDAEITIGFRTPRNLP